MLPSHDGDVQASAVPTLADLISARKTERGWSYQQLADRAHGAVSRQRWQQLGTGVRIKEFPEPATIQAIADALEVDVTLVVLGVARSIGFAVRTQDSSLAAMLPPGADLLNDEQRNAVLAVVRAMAPRQLTGANNEDTSTQDATRNPTLDGEAGLGGAPMIAAPRQQPDPSPRRAGPKVVPLDERERREYERKHTSPNTPQHQD